MLPDHAFRVLTLGGAGVYLLNLCVWRGHVVAFGGERCSVPSDVQLSNAVEAYLGASTSGNHREALKTLVAGIKETVAAGDFTNSAVALRRAIVPTLDYTSAQTLSRISKTIRPQVKSAHKTRLAILGSFTTSQLRDFIELALFASEIEPEIYEADFGVFRQEILDPGSGLYEFQPQLVFVATSWRDAAQLPQLTDDRDTVDAHVRAELESWQQLWRTAHEKLGCQIIQNNFECPPWRTFSNLEMRHPSGLGRQLAMMNQAFAEHAPPYVTIHDVDYLSAYAGRAAWGEERFFHHAKMPCAPEYLFDYAHSVASLVAAQLGLAKKCLVLDLDNTLWGGVIGDDGLGGIRLGQGEAEGEAFQSFQRYVKALRLRGVILAVCSKNEDANAREVFTKHTEMVLRLDDISCFVANWTDKAANLRTIAETLNIGLNSLVFVDDNPAERSIIRQLVPEVAVPELPTDAAGYIQAVERHRYFQAVSIGNEDLKRTEYYRGNALRQQAEESASSVDDFLKSLEMFGTIRPVDDGSLERTVQLINRSNQFNLRTKRYSSADVLAMLGNSDWITRTISLADRFGDNGLISVILAKMETDVLDIDTWLMSCRVLKRGVETLVLNDLCEIARKKGLRALRGEYIPTAKNGLVRDHYQNLGFVQIDHDSDGRTVWELPIAGWTPQKTFIQQRTTDE